MSLTVALLLAGAVGYLLGSISTGILYSRSLGRDIRTQGSKNSGATNMTRVHGFGKGMLTFLGDCVKGVLASLFGLWLGSKAAAPDGGTYAQLCACVGGTCAVLGHIWPAFFGFKGGKGVATCIGIGLVTYPPFGAIGAVLGVLAVVITKYVSVGSMLGVSAFAAGVTIRYGFWPAGLWSIVLAGLVIWRHRSNIQRLLHGNENKFGRHVE